MVKLLYVYDVCNRSGADPALACAIENNYRYVDLTAMLAVILIKLIVGGSIDGEQIEILEVLVKYLVQTSITTALVRLPSDVVGTVIYQCERGYPAEIFAVAAASGFLINVCRTRWTCTVSVVQASTLPFEWTC